MKTSKILIVLILLFLIVIISVYLIFLNSRRQSFALKRYNAEYDNYLNKTITGADLATLINKTVNENENNKIKKDEHGHYIENDQDSIKIEIKISITKKTYSMEEFYNKDTAEFVKYFSEQSFICRKIEYHEKTGKVSKLYFEQI